MLRPTLLLLGLLLLPLLAAGGAVTVTVDAGGPEQPFDPFKLTRCFGSGHATLALRDTWRRQLLQAKDDLGVRHVRFHGLLDDDMSVALGVGQFSFANVLNVFDFLVGNGVRPIVELSFMPEAYASGPETVFHYKGNITPPKDYEQWAKLVEALLDTLVDRYGPAELSAWRFEVWNEPNCGFWTGNQTEYFKLYNYTARAVRSRGTFLQVGGPATCQVAWLQELADFVALHRVPMDFLSTHLYPTDPNVPVSRTGFDDVIRNASELADRIGVPLVMTEFNCGLGIDCADSPYAAAFVVHVAQQIQSMPNLDTLSYWTFTDIFEEGGQISTPFNQQFGIQTHQGIPKPVYRALQAITHLHPAALVASVPNGTVDAIVTTDGKGVRAVVNNWNFHQLPVQAEAVTLVVANAPGQPRAATITVIDDGHANPVPLWVQMGRPTYPSPQQVADLISASQVQARPIQAVAAGNGSFAFNFTALPNSVTALEWLW